jgi:K+-transporting ATPase ATPase A chain
MRRRQRRLRVPDRDRRRGAVLQPRLQRGGVRRRRHRPLLDAPLRHPRRLHRRPDGRELGKQSIYAGINPTGFSENLYAYLSQANNNGSAWAGYTGFVQPHAPGNVGAYGITFADLLGGFVMVTARYAPILFVLAVAGAMAGKKVSPAGLGTMRTDNPTFVFLLIGIVILVGALTFFPAILLGPIANGLTGRLF